MFDEWALRTSIPCSPRVVFTENKRVEKLRYMHRNRGTRPGARAGTVELEQLSSLRRSEPGAVLVNQAQTAALSVRQIA